MKRRRDNTISAHQNSQELCKWIVCRCHHLWLSSTFSNGKPLPPQNCPFPCGIWTPPNRWFFGPPESTTQRASWSVEIFLLRDAAMLARSWES